MSSTTFLKLLQKTEFFSKQQQSVYMKFDKWSFFFNNKVSEIKTVEDFSSI